jgi:acyl-coenzyme A synthetase/AMP-(fatty) acid ligase
VFLDEMPMTGTGKIQKAILRQRFKAYAPATVPVD